MKGRVFILMGLGCVLGFAAVQYGGVVPQDWNLCLFALAALSVVYWLVVAGKYPSPPLPRSIYWPALLLPIYISLQLIPLDSALLKVLSPARAEALDYLRAAGLDVSTSPLSVLPTATLAHLFRMLAYLSIILLVRELAWEWRSQQWVVVYPLVAVGAVEAALGALQAGFGEPGVAGTYVNRNHFAGFLGTCLPFPLMFSISILRGSGGVFNQSGGWVAARCAASASLFVLLLASLLFSLSRMGFVSSFAALALVCVVLMWTKTRGAGRRISWKRASAISAAGALSLVVLLPSASLVARFADLAATENLDAAFRLNLWKDSLSVVAAYPIIGCGLGAFQPAFSTYKTGAPAYDVDYAHNDYLQFLAELGIVGFAIVAIFLAGVLLILLRRFRAARCCEEKGLTLACLASLTAIGVHSLADFNMYIPANAMAVAWTLGVALAPQVEQMDFCSATAEDLASIDNA